MTIDVLKYCLDIDSLKNFTRSAELNHLSQQALSQQIKNLENEVGVKLFERTNKSVHTTPAGEVFIRKIRPAVIQIDAALTQTKAFTLGKEGYLSIGSNGPSPRMYLVKVIEEFTKQYPNIDINLRSNEYVDICESFIDGEFDAIIVGDFKQFDHNEYNIKKCKSGVINAVFGINHPLANKSFVTKEELQKEQLICLDIPGEKEIQVLRMNRFKKMCGEIPQRIKMAKDTETIDLLVESGLGFTLLNSDLAGLYKQLTLKFVPIEGVTDSHPTWLIWRKDYSNPALTHFLKIAEMITV